MPRRADVGGDGPAAVDPDRTPRRFIRHPTEVPIEVGGSARRPWRQRRAHDVSFGGLAFQAEEGYHPGDVVTVSIPTVRPPFEAKGRVAWCRPGDGGFHVGIEFLEASDAFRARMVEQVCHIEEYRRRVIEEEGRRLSGDEAAREWIEKFGDRFPATTDSTDA